MMRTGDCRMCAGDTMPDPRWRRLRPLAGTGATRAACVLLAIAGWAWSAAAQQQLVDRVIARVDNTVITQTDLQAAVGFGVIEPGTADPVDTLIDRRLMMIDMNRRPPAPPDEAALDQEVARMRAVAGPRLSQLMAATGVDETRLRGIARDTLLLRDYLETRFPLVATSDVDAEQFYRAHPDRFTRDGALRPFGEVAADARRGAAEARRTARIDGWLANLRNRMDVEIVLRSPS